MNQPVHNPGHPSLHALTIPLSRNQQSIDHWISILRLSPTGKALVGYAEKHGVRIRIDRQGWQYAYYEADSRRIGLKPNRPDAEIIGNLAHELRHAWQHASGQLTSLTDTPMDFLLRTRATEADAEAVAILVCAELAEAGHPQYLEARLKGEMSDIAQAFLKGGKSGRISGLRAAYDQWFRNGRRRSSYLGYTLEWLEDNADAIAKTTSRHGFRPFNAGEIMKLGALPGGHNYLAESAGAPLDTALYKDGLTPAQQRKIDGIAQEIEGKRSRQHPRHIGPHPAPSLRM